MTATLLSLKLSPAQKRSVTKYGRQLDQIDKIAPSMRRHANAFAKLEPMICDLERYATLLGDYIDEQDDDKREIRVMLGFRVQEMCTELRNEYYRLWDRAPSNLSKPRHF
jgi:hypothetical protein